MIITKKQILTQLENVSIAINDQRFTDEHKINVAQSGVEGLIFELDKELNKSGFGG